jgi:hypothetical protein
MMIMKDGTPPGRPGFRGDRSLPVPRTACGTDPIPTQQAMGHNAPPLTGRWRPGRVTWRIGQIGGPGTAQCGVECTALPGCGTAGAHQTTLPAGSLPAGPLPAGPLPAGPLPAGPLPAGLLPAGLLPAGSLPAVTRPAWRRRAFWHTHPRQPQREACHGGRSSTAGGYRSPPRRRVHRELQRARAERAPSVVLCATIAV